ncbi:MAG: hypothetical protein ACRDHW_04430, partial [Ktedonobacteraceae bacterium]
MGYSTADITSLLTSMVTNSALTTSYTGPDVTGSMTLKDVFEKLFSDNVKASTTGDYEDFDGDVRLIKAIMDIGPENVAGINVQFTNSLGASSDADIITKSGDVYEVGGSQKVGKFGKQDIAATQFIKDGGTGNPGGQIHLWVDVPSNIMDMLRGFYELGKAVNPQNPNPKYGKWVNQPGFKKPADITKITPPPWVCGTGYVVK